MKKQKKLMIVAVLVTAIALVAGVITYNKGLANVGMSKHNGKQFDIDFAFQLFVTVDDNLKDVNPDIIKATRAAILKQNFSQARFSHYNQKQKEHINIFEVIKDGANAWDVRYRTKNNENEDYDNRFYSQVRVETVLGGRLEGYISGSSPIDDGKETY